MTSQQYQMNLFEESEVWTLSVADFRAKLSQLQETDEVLKIHEELCSLKLLGSHLFSDLNIYSLRTSEDCSTMTEGLHLKPSSEPWTNWGMMWNGNIIFEGDIVKMAKDVYSEPTYYEVVRHRGGAYRLESKQHGCELWLRHTDCEVVGNVYENQEYLKKRGN